MCERELETEQRQQHIDPQTLLAITNFLSCSPGRLIGSPLLGHVSQSSIFSPMIWTSCRRGYIIIGHPPTSCKCHYFAHNSMPRRSRLPLISWYLRPDAPVIYAGAFLFFFFFWQLGTVGGQYATQIELNCILILNSVVWNITVFTFKQYTFVKLNCSE